MQFVRGLTTRSGYERNKKITVQGLTRANEHAAKVVTVAIRLKIFFLIELEIQVRRNNAPRIHAPTPGFVALALNRIGFRYGSRGRGRLVDRPCLILEQHEPHRLGWEIAEVPVRTAEADSRFWDGFRFPTAGRLTDSMQRRPRAYLRWYVYAFTNSDANPPLQSKSRSTRQLVPLMSANRSQHRTDYSLVRVNGRALHPPIRLQPRRRASPLLAPWPDHRSSGRCAPCRRAVEYSVPNQAAP
jgi:hypothetical protein